MGVGGRRRDVRIRRICNLWRPLHVTAREKEEDQKANLPQIDRKI